MRESIGLFKAKRIDNGEWIEGFFTCATDCCGRSYFIDVPRKDPDDSNHRYEVDSETVCEFTGLTDKNGVKIFEGDKVEYNGTPHEVVFCDFAGNAYFGIWFAERGEIWSFSPEAPADRMAVIGNVHDDQV